MSFRRERYVPRGGPDGGNGGAGGNVIMEAREGIDSLNALAHRKHWKADRGKHGQGANRHGRCGDDLTVYVPPGTIVIDEAEGLVIKDLAAAGQHVVAARGGKGGKGNTHFKSAVNRAPREWTSGQPGEQRRLTLELKVIADVGLIGKPNAGKSTMLSRLSQARPEIAAYPFTTKHPNLGRVQIDYDRSFILADIPGLIAGAHAGAGLGHEFLRHIQRTGVLVHLVEPLPLDGSDPEENYRQIRDELCKFDPQLAQRPEVVAVTKAELPGATEVHRLLVERLPQPPLLVSAVTGLGLNVLTGRIAELLTPRDPA